MPNLKRCAKCETLKFRDTDFHRSKRRKDGVEPYCKDCRRTGGYNDQMLLAQKRWHLRNPQYTKSYRLRERLKTIEAYGGKCECCGETRREFLSIDHIDQKGAAHRRHDHGAGPIDAVLKKLGYPTDNFRLLCMNCNFALGKHGYCPHESFRSLYAVGGE
jgi:hypothetical protein